MSFRASENQIALGTSLQCCQLVSLPDWSNPAFSGVIRLPFGVELVLRPAPEQPWKADLTSVFSALAVWRILRLPRPPPHFD